MKESIVQQVISSSSSSSFFFFLIFLVLWAASDILIMLESCLANNSGPLRRQGNCNCNILIHAYSPIIISIGKNIIIK
jgi:hypothetical protein